MATPAPAPETPKLGIKATIFGLVFALAVLGGFGAATAASYEDAPYDDHKGEEHSDEYGDDDHGDEYGDDDHGDDEHGDDHADDDS